MVKKHPLDVKLVKNRHYMYLTVQDTGADDKVVFEGLTATDGRKDGKAYINNDIRRCLQTCQLERLIPLRLYNRLKELRSAATLGIAANCLELYRQMVDQQSTTYDLDCIDVLKALGLENYSGRLECK
jgi:hypothetical protein